MRNPCSFPLLVLGIPCDTCGLIRATSSHLKGQ
ncbi:MAG: DUF2752 domain-containing protein [Planctomycetes bacterium]|nr:DUF2752 domain-containing protein [Planctomycetota bacterium]